MNIAKSIQNNINSQDVTDLSSLSDGKVVSSTGPSHSQKDLNTESMQLTLKDKVQNNGLSTASMKPVQDATSNDHHMDSGKKIVYHFKCEL